MNPILIGGAAQVGGGILGNLLGAGDRKRAEREREAMLAELQGLDPAIQAQVMNEMSAQGQTLDPATRQASMDALAELQARARAGGLTLQDRAQLNEARNATEAQAQGNRRAVAQRMAQRGGGGSGADMALALQGESDAANRLGNAGVQAAGAASARAMQASEMAGQMAQRQRAQDFGEMDARRQALLRIQQFNASQRQSAQGQTFNNRMNLAGARNDVRQGNAQAHERQAAQTGQMLAGGGQAIAEGAAAYQNHQDNDAYMKWLRGG